MRSRNKVDGKMQERIANKDGTRWAYSRFYTLMQGRRRLDPVKAWVLRTYDVDGTTITIARGVSEADARNFVSKS